ncbi:MAG: VWA domain-containing protein [Kofleriaceae bacterium]|nr:VWA domain-containing protein [Kofleriaceae bacterium]
MRNLLGVLVLAAAVTTAYAGTRPAIHVEMRVARPSELEVTVDGATPPTVDRLTLHRAAHPQPAIHPTRIVPYADGTEPLALAILYPSSALFIGNDELTTDENERLDGWLFEIVKQTFDLVHVATRVPPGSRFALITYGTRAKIHVPWSPIAQLTGTSFGSQRDYPGTLDADFNAGLVAALDELERSGAPRQVLLSFAGDDFLETTAEVDAAVAKAKQRGVVSYSIVRENVAGPGPGHQSPATRGIYVLSRGAWITISRDGVREIVEKDVLGEIGGRYYASFDVGALHLHGPQDLVLAIDGTDTAPVPVQLAAAPRRWWSSRPLQIGVGVLLVGLLALALRLRARRAR